MWVRSVHQEDPLEKSMATHSSILAWRIPWTEEPDRLQFMGSQRVRHNFMTEQQQRGKREKYEEGMFKESGLLLFLFCLWAHPRE